MDKDIDGILTSAYKNSIRGYRIASFIVTVTTLLVWVFLFWIFTAGPLNSNFSNINHGDTVKIKSGSYRGVIGRADTAECMEPWTILVRDHTFKKYYSCKAWWNLEKIQ